MEDKINMPSHYVGSQGLEAIEVHKNFMDENMLYGFYLGNALKYLIRHLKKNGVEMVIRLTKFGATMRELGELKTMKEFYESLDEYAEETCE